MSGDARFLIMMAASALVFLAVLRISLACRQRPPSLPAMAAVAGVVVVGGMLYGRLAAQAGFPWWLYLFPPMLVWLFLPPLAFRMRGSETVRYLALAILAGPLVHVLFSFFLGWGEFIPAWRIPSLAELVG